MSDLRFDYVLIGGGRTSADAAQSIRSLDQDGSIAIIALEDRKPYDRPPLSKNFLQGRPPEPEDVESKPDDFFEKHRVELMRGVAATSIDRAAKTVSLNDGRKIEYGKLLIATGATPRVLTIPGGGLQGVHYLRTADDAVRLRDAAKKAKRIVLVGSGYIGSEVAASLTSEGVDCTIVSRGKYPWDVFLSEASGNFLRKYFEGKGVQFRFGAEPAEFVGEEKFEAVRLTSGELLDGDLVVVGIGVDLNTELAKGAGLQTDERKGAIIVDERLRTEDPSIWAAGDVASFPDVTVGKRWHAEHYMNAKWQGELVGRSMAGSDESYDKVAYFYSDIFDLAFILRGDAEAKNSVKVLGDIDSGEFIELYANDKGELVMGLAFTRDFDRQDAIGDKLETYIREKRLAATLTDLDF